MAKAPDMPPANLLIADDTGLGKTIEAGLIAQELILRHDPGPLLHRLQRAGEAPAGTPDQLEPGTRPLPSLRSGDPADRRLA